MRFIGSLGGVLAPHVSAAGALVAADRDNQGRGSPAERLVRQLSGHGVTWVAFAAAPSAPLIGFDDAAGQHGTIGFQVLPGHDETEVVNPGEGGQIGAVERGDASAAGSVRHVEVFQMVSVRTSIFGRPRRLSRDRHANANYTVICVEPDKPPQKGTRVVQRSFL